MNYNKVNVITNELSNTKEFRPVEELYVAKDVTIKNLYDRINALEKALSERDKELATYKTSIQEAFKLLQAKFDLVSDGISKTNDATNAEIANIKQSIQLLGGVL